ncbi:MAG: MerR family transcriptional regulator [Pseudomonadota bacterium]
MQLKVGELARRTGLTVRTLHHYDEIGLLSPSARSERGYRLYGRDDVRRLYQVLALVRLGLPLARIACVLDGADIASVLAQQLAAIDAQIAHGCALREQLRLLQSQFERHDEPAVGDYLQTLELMTLWGKYFSSEEIHALGQRKRAIASGPDYGAQWQQLIAAVRAQMQAGAPPQDATTQRLCGEWRALVQEFTGNDVHLTQKLSAMYEQESSLEFHTGIDAAMRDYVRSALAATPTPTTSRGDDASND